MTRLLLQSADQMAGWVDMEEAKREMKREYELMAEIAILRAVLREVKISLMNLGEDGWSDAPYLLSKIRSALTSTERNGK